MKSAEKPHVLIAYPLRPRFMEVLEAHYTLHRLDLATDKGALLELAGPVCTAMVVNGHVAVDAAMLDRLPALKLAACSSAGFDMIDLEEMSRRGITLTNTSVALVKVAGLATVSLGPAFWAFCALIIVGAASDVFTCAATIWDTLEDRGAFTDGREVVPDTDAAVRERRIVEGAPPAPDSAG